MKKWLMAILFGSVLVLGACGGDSDTEDATDDAADTEEVEDDAADEGATVDAGAAEDLYKQSCASCHGADLSGQGAFPAVSGTGLSADEIEGIIETGQGSMPAGLLSGEDATVVAEWLATQ